MPMNLIWKLDIAHGEPIDDIFPSHYLKHNGDSHSLMAINGGNADDSIHIISHVSSRRPTVGSFARSHYTPIVPQENNKLISQ